MGGARACGLQRSGPAVGAIGDSIEDWDAEIAETAPVPGKQAEMRPRKAISDTPIEDPPPPGAFPPTPPADVL